MCDLTTPSEEFKLTLYSLDDFPDDAMDADELVLRERVSKVWDEIS